MAEQFTTRIHNGWWLGAKHRPSPNFNTRPTNCTVSLLVIHNISLPPNQFGGQHIEHFFCNRLNTAAHPYFKTIEHLKVSAHCLIKRTGQTLQFVSFNDRAWHAGQSCYEGRANCNDFSVGIELEGTDAQPYTTEQYASLQQLTRTLIRHYPSITPTHITGHEHIAPGRKTDPGESFDWALYKSAL